MPHLSYVGDATIGADSNIGAGTITANYDGYRKHKTVIGDGVRIGSDTVLVAPVEVGDGAWTGAGSVITNDVAPDALAVTRSPQREVPGYAQRRRRGRGDPGRHSIDPGGADETGTPREQHGAPSGSAASVSHRKGTGPHTGRHRLFLVGRGRAPIVAHFASLILSSSSRSCPRSAAVIVCFGAVDHHDSLRP